MMLLFNLCLALDAMHRCHSLFYFATLTIAGRITRPFSR